jgi:tetratricopeptide (TPR) repeat protein
MGRDEDQRPVSRLERGDPGVAVEAMLRELASIEDAEALRALRHAWHMNAGERAISASLIEAATQPLSAAHQEQIVHRLLRERDTADRPRAKRLLLSTLRRGPLWSIAAACALGCIVWSGATASNLERVQLTTHLGPRRTHVAAGVSAYVPRPRGPGQAIAAERPSRPRVGEALTQLAEAYAQQRRFDEAEALYQKALHEREQRLGPTHKDVADALTRLASLYQSQHLYAKAEPLYGRALEIDPPFAVF